jgi:TPR repeat protein
LHRRNGVGLDLKRAVNYDEKAPDQRDAIPQFDYEKVADQGDTIAQLDSDSRIEFGKGVTVDLKSAAGCYKKSGDEGNSEAQLRYGFCLRFGKGLAVDLKLAVNGVCAMS